MSQPNGQVGSALDAFMSQADFSAAHMRTILASPNETYGAIGRADFAGPWIVRSLMALRSIPASLARSSPRATRSTSATTNPSIKRLLGIPFTLLADQPPTELLFGIQGQFWRMNGGLERMTAEDFRLPVPPGRARAVWNFRLEAVGAATRLHTETRIRCGDDDARRQFRRYWFIIRPFSGLLRNAILAEIAREAERQ